MKPALITALLFAGCLLAALAARAEIPRPGVLRDRCEVIERNHVYTGDGTPQFTQFIFDDDHAIAAWRMAKGQRIARERGGWTVTWADEGAIREVWALTLNETWSQHDRELDERALVPECRRRGLSKVTKP
jgi:hypothetical protein